MLSRNKIAIFVAHNYAESVSLFSIDELRNFDFTMRVSGHLLASYRLVWRGTVAYFIVRVS